MIKREILAKISQWLGKEKILIIKGARQVGKTYILQTLKKNLENQGKKVVYILADDLDNQSLLQSVASLELYLKQYYNFPNVFIYLMIDEFQVLKEAGLFLKNIFDKHKDKLQLIVSGSSSLEINKNSEYLTGRALHFELDRVNFKEYFDFTEGIESQRYSLSQFKELKLFYNTLQSRLNLNLENYLSYGAYPEILITQGAAAKEEILKSIIKTYIDKDIINQLKVENVNGFNHLIKILAAQTGQLVNYTELANTTNLSINTVKKYIDILIGTYIIELMTPYFKNIRSEISKMPKVYLADNGIRNYLLRNFNSSLSGQGQLIENFVYNTLRTQYQKEYLHFYRTIGGAEIDFVIESNQGQLIIAEVKYRHQLKLPAIMNNFEKRYRKGKMKLIINKDVLQQVDDAYFIPVALLPFLDLSIVN